MSNLPNRKERRKMAKNLGLLGKKSSNNEEKSRRSSALGKLIHLRNLTEQRNRSKNSN